MKLRPIPPLKLKSMFLFIGRLLAIMAGAVVMSVSYNILVIPYGLLSGGISGLALIGHYLWHFPFNMGVFILNIPIFILGLKELNWKFILYSLVGTLSLVVALPLTKPLLSVPRIDLFLAAIFSGVVGGFGGGIILKMGSSTGGTDIISIIAKKKWNISVGACSFYLNVIVILLSLCLFDIKIALYTVVSMWVSGKVTDKVIEGLSSNKSVVIISEDNDLIAARIMEELIRGVTFLEGVGAYSGDSKRVINCVVSHYEIPKLKEIVLGIDPKAFMFITETTEVAGKGFTLPL